MIKWALDSTRAWTQHYYYCCYTRVLGLGRRWGGSLFAYAAKTPPMGTLDEGGWWG